MEATQGFSTAKLQPVLDAAGNNVNLLTSGPSGGASVLGFVIDKINQTDNTETAQSTTPTATATGANILLDGTVTNALRVGLHNCTLMAHDSGSLNYVVARGTIQINPSNP